MVGLTMMPNKKRSECGRAASLANPDALGHPHRSTLCLQQFSILNIALQGGLEVECRTIVSSVTGGHIAGLLKAKAHFLQ
jgi:hypothetical protein